MRPRRSTLSPLALVLLAACAAEPAPPPPAVPPPGPVVTARPPALASPTSVRRTMVLDTRVSGLSVETLASDGTLTVVSDLHDNGRGPHTDATLHLAPDGTIRALEAKGHHEMGAVVEESFAVEGGKAHWKSHEESGEKALTAPAFYLPIADLPESIGLLAEALLKAGHPLALLPGGEASLEKVGEANVAAPAGKRHLTAYDVLGVDLRPEHVWMNDDGSWFGDVDPGFSIVPEGWEGVIDPLVLEQRKFDRERDRKIAERLAHHPPAAGLAYTHARVLDVERGAWLPDQTVVVVGDVIRSVGPSKAARVPARAEVVDLAGKALIPGLWDMHAHLQEPDGPLNLASGVTTARDVGNDPDVLDDLKARFDAGTAAGPHVLRAGFIEGRGPDAASAKVTAETPAEAKAAVEFYAKRGYEMIKIYNSVKTELVPILTKEAHAHGMTVTGHIPVHMLANEAVKAGYDGIEHVNMLFNNFFADHDTDTRTTLRFSLMGDQGADFDFKAKPVQEFFALLRQHHTVVDPTFDAFEDLLVAEQGKVIPGTEWLVSRLPVQVQRAFLTGGLPLEGKAERYARSWDKIVQMVKALHDAGVTTVVGTDELAGLELHHELDLFVRGGLSPADALRDATIVPARAMRLDKKTGSIAVGKVADLAVIDGDPLARISDARRVVSAVRGGVVFPSKELFESVAVRYWQ